MKRFTILLLPLCLAAAGCAGSALRPDDSQQQEIQALKARILDLQRESAMNQVEMSQLRQQVADMEARNGGSARPPAPAITSRPAPSSPSQKSSYEEPKPAPARPLAPAPAPRPRRETVRQPVTPAEPIEEVDIALPENEPKPPPPRHTPAAPAAPAPKPATVIPPKPYATPLPTAPAPAKPLRPEPAIPLPAAPPAAAPAPASPGEEPAAAEGLSPATQALYDRGYTLFHQGHFVDAEASFQRFLQSNPKSELADNAQYWIGECRYSRNDVKGALAAFREVVERFPKGNKVPDAMLKEGQCMEAMGDTEGARVTYREVNRRFPGSAAAAVAEERRGKLK
jgi:tol-pal system protein YbgF